MRYETSWPTADDVVALLADRWREPLPGEVVKRTRLLIIDYLISAYSGSAQTEQVALRRGLISENEDGRCTVIGDSARTTPEAAAFLNASAATASELDDRLPETRSHPSVHVIPIALALSEELGLSEAELIRSVAMGYEFSGILGVMYVDRPSWLHPHGFWSTAAGAVAGAAALGWTTERLPDLINCAVSLSPRAPFAAAWEGATIRNAYAGFASSVALRCLVCVESGLTGPRAGLEFVGQRVGIASGRLQEWVQANRPYVVERVTAKWLPVCHTLYPYIEGLRRIVKDGAVNDIAEIEIHGPAGLRSFMNYRPRNQLAARFSLPYTLAEEYLRGLRPNHYFHVDEKETQLVADAVYLSRVDVPGAVIVKTAGGGTFSEAIDEAPSSARMELQEEIVCSKYELTFPSNRRLDSLESVDQLWDNLVATPGSGRIALYKWVR